MLIISCSCKLHINFEILHISYPILILNFWKNIQKIFWDESSEQCASSILEMVYTNFGPAIRIPPDNPAFAPLSIAHTFRIIFVYMPMYIYIYIYTYKIISIYLYMYIYIYIYIYIIVYSHVCKDFCNYMFIYLCICICI